MRRQIKKIAFLLKSNLSYDGRVLAEVDSLAQCYPNTQLKIFLLSDGEYKPMVFDKNVKVERIDIFTRKSRFRKQLVPITTLIYTVICFFKVLKFRPEVLHVHDIFPLPVAYLYTLFFSPILFYDDHELFKQNADPFHKGLFFLEAKILKKADQVFVANNHRSRIIRWVYGIPSRKVSVLENYNHLRDTSPIELQDHLFLNILNRIHNEGGLAILHQGQVSKGRGVDYLIEVAKSIELNTKIVFLGISDVRYAELLSQYPILKNTSFNIGYKPYYQINEYWSRVDATMVFYDTQDVNNRYCAPNRLYLALSNKVPLLVNAKNPVLSSAVESHGAGLSCEIDNINSTVNQFIASIRAGLFYPNKNQDFNFSRNSKPILIDSYERITK